MSRRPRAPTQASPAHSEPTAEPSGWWRCHRWELVILALGIALRLVFLIGEAKGNPFHSNLVMDEKVHWDWAGEVLAKGSLDQAFFRPPLYYYLLAGMRALFGDSIFWARFVSSLFGIGSAVLAFRLARRVAPPALAGIAALVLVLAKESLYFDTRLLTDPLASFLMMAALTAMVCRPERPIRFGLLVGLAELARQVAVILIPVWLLLELRRRRQAGEKGRSWVLATARNGSLVMLAYAAALVPSTLHNWYRSHDFVPVAWNSGINFYIGNNPKSDGMTAVEYDFRKDWWGSYWDFIRAAEKAEGRSLAPSEISGYWLRRGARFWTEQPRAALELLVRKARLFASGAEIPNNLPISPQVDAAGWVFAYWPVRVRWLLIFLLPAALWSFWSRAENAVRAAALAAVLYAGLISAVFVCSRYRVPVYPPLVVVAATTLAALRRRGENAPPRPILALAIAIGVGLGFTVHIPSSAPAYQVAVGNMALKRLELDSAEAAFRRAQALDDTAIQLHEGLGMIAEKRGQSERALEEYRREASLSNSAFARSRIAAVLYGLRRYEEALEFSRPLAAEFDDVSILHGQILIGLGRRAEARRHLEANRQRGFAPNDTDYLLALIGALDGDPGALALIDRHPGEERFERLRVLIKPH